MALPLTKGHLDCPAAPTASYLLPGNIPVARGATLTLSGENFGPIASSLTVNAQDLPCDTSSWVSSTSVLCAAPSGSGPVARRLSVTVFNIAGTGVDVLYDPPTAAPTQLPRCELGIASSLDVHERPGADAARGDAVGLVCLSFRSAHQCLAQPEPDAAAIEHTDELTDITAFSEPDGLPYFRTYAEPDDTTVQLTNAVAHTEVRSLMRWFGRARAKRNMQCALSPTSSPTPSPTATPTPSPTPRCVSTCIQQQA